MTALNLQDVVRHPAKPEWGRGLVVDVKGSKVQVLFENATGGVATKLDTSRVALEVLKGVRVPQLEHLRFKTTEGVVCVDGRFVSFDNLFKHFLQVCPEGFSSATITKCVFRPSRSAIPADADHPFRQGDHPGRDAAG